MWDKSHLQFRCTSNIKRTFREIENRRSERKISSRNVRVIFGNYRYSICQTEAHFVVTALSQESGLAVEGLEMENVSMVSIVSV